MALQFHAPSFVRPKDYEGLDRLQTQLPQTLDSIINAYLLAKKEQEARGIAANESTLKYGFDVAQTNPQEIMQGRQMAPQQGPDQAGLNQGIAAIRDMYRKQFAQQDLSTRAAEADISLTEARTQDLLRRPEQMEQREITRAGISESKETRKAEQKKGDMEATLSLYETARDGLLSGLGGSSTGPIMGRIPAITSKQQIAAGGVAAMAPVLKQLFRVSGEGVFTDRDQALLLEMVPQRTDNPEAIREKIKNIDNIVKAKLRVAQSDTRSAQSTPVALTGDKAARLAELRAKMGRR